MKKNRYELRLRNSGMFSIVNEVVQYLHLAQTHGYEFFIDWRHSCYLDPEQESDPWEYYFEPCFEHVERQSGQTLLPVGKSIACSKDNVITPRLLDGQCRPLLLPHDRLVPNALIDRYIRLKPHVAEKIESFIQQHFADFTIGMHLRGLGRTHGGAQELRQQGGHHSGIDYQRFFQPLDAALQKTPSARLLICSDSQDVIDHVSKEYGEQVISYQASRSQFGEMHANHPKNQGLTFSPYKLGLDIVIEAYLLSRTDFFIHGNSNVANYVLSLNPKLEACYVYQ